eukprot:TRINITY_DN8842_c0_g1_i3.p1 TRINITY_DN8842_c0_g1~~TRINITY_DN8842_c0_g1_i3.p1  ORF type:complete len:243 (+),score=59.99 TRINITY_DN8842_c0_g1_i3:54-782(+)
MHTFISRRIRIAISVSAQIFAKRSIHTSILDDKLRQRLAHIQKEYPDIVELLADPNALKSHDAVEVRRKANDYANIVKVKQEIDAKNEEITQLQELKKEASADKDVLAMVEQDLEQCAVAMQELEEKLLDVIAPTESVDERDAVLEIRPGTGGLEASLFAQDLLKMYKGYSDHKGWRFEPIEITSTDVGGFRVRFSSSSFIYPFYLYFYKDLTNCVVCFPVLCFLFMTPFVFFFFFFSLFLS